MVRITFNRNWNNKLHCDVFSTVRLANENKYQVGNLYEVVLLDGDQILFTKIVKLYSINKTDLNSISVGMAMIDTGMCLEKTKAMFRTMYKNKVQDIDKEPLFHLILGKP